jgi:hypothetical protein
MRQHVDTQGMGGEPRSVLPVFLLPRFNAVVHAFKHENFAILAAAFETGLEARGCPDDRLHRNLERESQLVDAVTGYGLAWFPLIFDWGHRPVRSTFIHCQHDVSEDAPHPFEPYLGLVTRFCRRHCLDRFIHGVRGTYIVFEGDPPLPIAVSDRFLIRVDVDFIKFRESQGHVVTQRNARGNREGPQ